MFMELYLDVDTALARKSMIPREVLTGSRPGYLSDRVVIRLFTMFIGNETHF